VTVGPEGQAAVATPRTSRRTSPGRSRTAEQLGSRSGRVTVTLTGPMSWRRAFPTDDLDRTDFPDLPQGDVHAVVHGPGRYVIGRNEPLSATEARCVRRRGRTSAVIPGRLRDHVLGGRFWKDAKRTVLPDGDGVLAACPVNCCFDGNGNPSAPRPPRGDGRPRSWPPPGLFRPDHPSERVRLLGRPVKGRQWG